jgi:hypothetical protein
MRRRALLAAAPALVAVPAAAATYTVLPAQAEAAERRRYRRHRRYRAGLLLEDVEGEASFGRRSGDFEGDCLITALHHGRKLHAAGFLRGEADLEGRRRDFEIDIEDRFRRVGVDLAGRRGRTTLDLAPVEVADFGRRELEIDLDAVKLDLRGPYARQLEQLFAALAEALEDEDGWRKRGRRDDDVEELVEAINAILAKTLHTTDAGRDHHRERAA